MKHSQYKQWIQLSLYDELDTEQKKALGAHLASCRDCQSELVALKRFQEVVSKHKPSEVAEDILKEARLELRAALRAERSGESWWHRLLVWIELPWPSLVRVAVSSGVTLVAGVLIGYAVFRAPAEQSGLSLQRAPAVTHFEQGETQITDVRFLDADPSDGEVEFAFEAVRPVRVRGNIDDEQIQRVLSQALLNERNPGMRLRTVTAIASTRAPHPDPQVKNALIQAVKHDDNPGVRKEALQALQKFRSDEDIKEALLYVLANDKNEGLRIDAINGLSAATIEGKIVSKEILNVLREKMRSDRNNYIRLRAKAVLEEVERQ